MNARDLYVLVRRLGIESDGKIDYVLLIDNLKSKNDVWWSKYIGDQKVAPSSSLASFLQTSLATKLKHYFTLEPAEKMTRRLAEEHAAMQFGAAELRKALLVLG